MVTRWGMSDELGMVQLAPRQNPYLGGIDAYHGNARPFSEETARTIDAEIRTILGDSLEQARKLLIAQDLGPGARVRERARSHQHALAGHGIHQDSAR